VHGAVFAWAVIFLTHPAGVPVWDRCAKCALLLVVAICFGCVNDAFHVRRVHINLVDQGVVFLHRHRLLFIPECNQLTHSGFWQVRFVPRSNLMAALSDTVFTSLFANESAAKSARISSFTLPRSKLPAFVPSTKETREHRA